MMAPLPITWLIYELDKTHEVENHSLALDKLTRFDLLHFNASQDFAINAKTRAALSKLPNPFTDDPYGYLLDEVRKAKEFEKLTKWWESQNARTQFKQCPKVDKRAKWALGIAIGLAILELIKLLARLN